MTRLNFFLPKELHCRFKSICALQGKNMGEVVRKFIEQYVDKAEKSWMGEASRGRQQRLHKAAQTDPGESNLDSRSGL
jgi:hypothetical protein